MKTLIILRHGKAEPYDAKPDDFDRVLAERGKRNAGDMGLLILKKFGVPELILASAAARASETASLAAVALGYPAERIQTDVNLYLVSAERMLKTLCRLSNEINSCLLVGHNPGLTDLINLLNVRIDNLPTGSAACFNFKTDLWSEISAGNARFQWLQLAREL